MNQPTIQQQAIEGLRAADAHRDYLVISHGVGRELHHKLSRTLAEKQRHDHCTVFLTTWGGDPNGGYRAARALRHHYKHIRLAVPSYCKSAGTLIAIAADELAIGDLGELGPLDIQVRKGSELQENSSGLDIMQALQAVTHHTQDAFHRLMLGTRGFGLSTKLCAEFAATVASGIASPLISQIDPIRLGEMQRATRVALEYGQRLNQYSNNLREGALERLIGEYPAHGFVIDRKEAGELFHRVHHLNDAEAVFCDVFWPYVEQQRDADPILIEFNSDGAVGANDESANRQGDQLEAANEPERVDEPEGDGEREPGADQDPAASDGQGLSIRALSVGSIP
ncbi:SDH family Clp fold serine proteinase [Lysobacter olei]